MSRHRTLLVLATTVSLAAACTRERENLLHVIAERAPGLQRSSLVQFRGVPVGRVKQVYFTNSGVRIDILLDRDDVPIRTLDTVRISALGPLGAPVVDIQPGDQAAPLILHGATLPRVRPESTVAMPVSTWRSLVRALGLEAAPTPTPATSAAPATADTAAASPSVPADSAPRR